VLVQVHLDTPETDLNAAGERGTAGSVPAGLWSQNSFNLMIYINLFLVIGFGGRFVVRFSECSEDLRSVVRQFWLA
jgi:hypothetical protein